MKAHWWSCVLGLLYMPAEVILSTWSVSQVPMSISLKKVNSSAEITCSCSLSYLIVFKLQRRFHGNEPVVFLSLENGEVTKNTIAEEFTDRINIQQIEGGYGFTLELSLLRLEDTDLYYCNWIHMESEKLETVSSNGTIIIVRDRDPHEQCKHLVLDFIFIGLSVTAFTVLFLFLGVLIVRCLRFKKHFRPARAVKPSRPNRPQHVCHQQRAQHCPYLVTSLHTMDDDKR
ncbi:uncharacterized protein LOC119915737 [Micropterus salmoides]|uniref:uncharacterized protein LOC119915737 n=1 Tax=Micropterus salmoides TaxID=27706 RepID=UPI0018EB0B74|nr:uncharacterized protein LOC119915737 [Micropterus salmoides]